MNYRSLPDLDENGNLPPGVHDATLADVERLFGQFQRSGRRCKLLEKLKEYIEEIKKAGWAATVIVDGSFVMSHVDEPDDIDVVLVLPPTWDMAADVRPFEYNLLSIKRVKRHFGFDVFPVRYASREYDYWTDFFMQVNPKWSQPLNVPLGSRKGILRIVT